MNRRLWAIRAGVTLAGLVVIGLVIVANQPVTLVNRTFPEDGGAVGADNRVGLEFAQPMNPGTVNTLFQIAPTTSGKLNWDGQRLWFIPDQTFQPGVCYAGQLKAGAVSQRGQRITADLTWHFIARPRSILFLTVAAGGRQLWRLPDIGGSATALTPLRDSVIDFAPEQSGDQIAYSVSNNQRGTDLWLMAPDGGNNHSLVDCGPDQCQAPAWSPDGRLIAFSRYPAGKYAEEAKYPARIWTVDLNTHVSVPLYPDAQVLGQNPSWSPDGRWLAFFDAGVSRIRALNLQTRQEVSLTTSSNMAGAWSPDSNRMLINDLHSDHGAAKSVVYMADISRQTNTIVLGQQADGSFYGPAAWSPNGDWVVVRVQRPNNGPGDQLWLMRPDGQEGRFITSDPAYAYVSYSWDGCGLSLLMQRLVLNKTGANREIVVWSMATAQFHVLAQDGSAPVWLP